MSLPVALAVFGTLFAVAVAFDAVRAGEGVLLHRQARPILGETHGAAGREAAPRLPKGSNANGRE